MSLVCFVFGVIFALCRIPLSETDVMENTRDPSYKRELPFEAPYRRERRQGEQGENLGREQRAREAAAKRPDKKARVTTALHESTQ